MKSVVVLLTAAAMAAAAQAAERPPITSVSHFSVYASDMAKADAFYAGYLGGMKRDDPENAKGVRYYFNPIQFVEVLPLPAGWTSVSRMDHAAFNTSDAKALRKYLSANHIAVPRRVEKASDGSLWFDVVDPEGNKIQFVQPPKDPAAVPPNPLSNHIIHFGFIVRDPAKENAFYRTVLGFRPYWYGGPEGKPPAWISQQVPNGTDWMEYMVEAGPVSQATSGVLDHFSLGVRNMETTVTLLTSEDHVSEKNDGPKIGRDGKWQFNMYDPDGTRAEFMEFHAVTKPCCSAFTASDPED